MHENGTFIRSRSMPRPDGLTASSNALYFTFGCKFKTQNFELKHKIFFIFTKNKR